SRACSDENGSRTAVREGGNPVRPSPLLPSNATTATLWVIRSLRTHCTARPGRGMTSWQQKTARRRFLLFCFAGSAPVSNGGGESLRAVPGGDQAAGAARALTLADRRLLSRAALFLWKMPLSATVSTMDWALANSSVALALS